MIYIDIQQCLASRFISFSVPRAFVQFCPSSLLGCLISWFPVPFLLERPWNLHANKISKDAFSSPNSLNWVCRLDAGLTKHPYEKKFLTMRQRFTNKQKSLSPTAPLPVNWLFAARTDCLRFYHFQESLEVSAHCHSSCSALCSLCRLQQPRCACQPRTKLLPIALGHFV